MIAESPRLRRPAPTLRPASPVDREFLYRVYASTRAEEMAAVHWPDEAVDAFLRQQFDAQDRHYRAHFADASFDLVVVDGQRAGRLYLDRRAGETSLIDIALLPEYRGRGVGTHLLGDVLAGARARGASVTLHVECNNPARRWYQRLGFRVEEDQGVYLFLRWQAPEGVL